MELLEERAMLRTTLYLDFGEGFAGGVLNMTADQLVGTINGPDLTFELDGTDVLQFQSLQNLVAAKKVDFNGTGLKGDVNDYKALRDSIISIVTRIYEPFDVDVKEAFASSLADVNSAYHSNDGDPTGQYDAYVFIANITDLTLGGVSVGSFIGIYGIASAIDLFGGQNDTDEAVIVCADLLIQDYTSPTFGFPLDVALGNVAAHEAGHTFALFHSNSGVFYPGPEAFEIFLQSTSDMIREGGDNTDLQNILMITRFDLVEGDGNEDPTFTVNSYDTLASDPDIGLNPNIAYITGTGAFDTIEIVRMTATTAKVTVTPYVDAGFTTPVSTPALTYVVATNLSGGLLIDAGRSGDLITIDARLNTTIRLRGGQGTNQLKVIANGVTDATFTPESSLEKVPGLSSAIGGLLTLTGGAFGTTVINISEFSSDGTVRVDGFTNFKWLSPGDGHVNLTINGSSISGQVKGPNGLVSTVVSSFVNVTNVTVDATPLNFGVFDADDVFTIGSAGLAAPGLKNLTLKGGAGNDTLNINSANFALPVAGGAFTFDGGAGIDTIASAADANFTLTNTSLSTSATSIVQFVPLTVEVAKISGGSGDNIFTIKSWAGTGTINGLDGNDTFIFGDAGDIDTVTGRLTVIGGSGFDTLMLDDSGNAAVEDYTIGATLATSSGAFGGVVYDSTFEDIVVIGSTGNNRFVVTPNVNATVHVNGMNPPFGTSLPDGDQFSLNYNGVASSRKFTPQGPGAGAFSFTGGQKAVFFTDIEILGSLYAAGADIGKGSKPLVKLYNSLTDAVVLSFYAYNKSFAGGVRVAMADVNGDGVLDVITAPGPGKITGSLGDNIKVFDGAYLLNHINAQRQVSDADAAAAVIADFRPQGNGYFSGLYIAAGDVNGDGTPDIITSRSTGSSQVRVFANKKGGAITGASNTTPITITVASTLGMANGDQVTIANVNGNTAANGTWTVTNVTATTFQLVGSAGNGAYTSGGTWFDFTQFAAFTPYTAKEKVTTGAVVGVGDVDDDGILDIVTAPGNGSVVTVKVFDYDDIVASPLVNNIHVPLPRYQFLGFESTFKNSVSLAVGDTNGDGVAEIVLGAGAGGGSRVRVFDTFGNLLKQFKAYTTGNINAPLRLALRSDFPTGSARLFLAQSNDGRSREIRVFDALSGGMVDSFLETAPEFNAGLFLG